MATGVTNEPETDFRRTKLQVSVEGKWIVWFDGDVDNDVNWIYCCNGFVGGILSK